MEHRFKPFFIGAYPRSRTAWLSVLLTGNGRYCYHDLIGKISKLSELQSKLSDTDGVSDTSLPLVFPDVKKMYPDSPFVFINRDVDECRESYRKLDLEDLVLDVDEAFKILSYAAKEMKDDPDVVVIEYADLNKEETIREIWDFCIGGRFNYRRWEMLQNMKIEVMLAPVKERFKEVMGKV